MSNQPTVDMSKIARTPTKTGYELACNVYSMEQLSKVIEAAGDRVGRAYINGYGCSIVRAIVKKS